MKVKTGCAIPCYLGGERTIELIHKLEQLVDLVVLVDDKCPIYTGQMAFARVNSEITHILFNLENQGVGASTIRGFDYLIKNDCDIIIKIDADGQMDPSLIPALIHPIVESEVEAVKGNRFTSVDHILLMPKIRILGNLGLSFLNKLSTGYWELFDPTNGFLAFKTTALKRVRTDKVDDRYFFESDLLFQCALAQITFSQLPMRSAYGNEISSLQPISEIQRFSHKHLINFLKRIIYQYFLLDFNAGSLEILGGSICLLLTLVIATKVFFSGILYKQYATPGDASLITILVVITTQMLIAFLYYDATQQPLLRRLAK